MTVRGIDHIGLTVPDLEAATRFLADALGAEVLYDTLPADRGPVGGPQTEQRLGVPPGTRQLAIRMLALPDGPGIELFAYHPPGRPPALPSDLGWQHLALYVDDLDAALTRAVEAGARPPGPAPPPPRPRGRPRQPLRLPPHPWGSTLELVTYPDPQPYEQETQQRRWRPAYSASSGRR
ncbi:VOC family protein [Streptomyces albus]|nr:VOC family protein [Streptomyces albus]